MGEYDQNMIRMGAEEICWEGADWTKVAQDRDGLL